MNRLFLTRLGLSLLGLIFCATLAATQTTCNAPSQIDFTQQSQIDEFATNYPNCSSVKTIRISGDHISDLGGLRQIRNIENLSISRTSALTSLAGLENIEAISASCYIQNTRNLSTLQGLNSVKYIRNVFVANNLDLQTVGLGKLETTDNLNILQNKGLVALGLPNLRQAQTLSINNNPGLSTLESLANVEHINNFRIKNNPDLVSLDGLASLQILEFGLEIIGNPILSDISALGDFRFNVNAPFFKIYNNPSLSNCAITAFCEDVMNNASSQNSEVRNNARGCNTKSEISISCGGQSLCENLPDELYFTAQAQIDNFANNYPNCTQIKKIFLVGNNIQNLDGLAQITKADTFGLFNTSIRNLNGLENLTEVSGRFRIDDNRLLESLTALQSLSRVGDMTINTNGELLDLQGLENISRFQDLFLSANPKLQSLSGLDNVQYVQVRVVLQNHPQLTDISALEQLRFTTTRARFSIISNSKLSNCAINSVCQLVTLDSQAAVQINGNASGCTSKEEVQVACSSGNCNGIPAVVRFTTQAQVDNFGANYPNCTLAGDIFISGDNITNLNGLSKLTEVRNLWVGSTTVLSSLAGLHNIKTAKSIQIRENAALPVLTLHIERAEILNIYKNPILEHIELEQLAWLRYTMSIQENPRLFNLGNIGLTFTENLKIKFNSLLKNLNGFTKLQTLEFGLEIIGNPVLTDISALDGMRFNAELPYFKVYNNASLSDCAITSFCEDVQNNPNSENSEIRNNATGCNNKTELKQSCPGEALEVISYTCPQQYPQPNGELTYEITVRNKGLSSSEPTPLYWLSSIGGGRYMPYAFTKQGETTVPSIAAGQSLTFEATFIQTDIPRFLGDVLYGDVGVRAHTFSFEEMPDGYGSFGEDYINVDLFCKKTEANLQAKLFTDDPTYGEDGMINYTIQLINDSDAVAHNVRVTYAVAGIPGVDLVSFEVDRNENTYTRTNEYPGSVIYDWTAARVEARDTVTFKVSCKTNRFAREEFTFTTTAYSPHIIDTNPEDNSPSLRFVARSNAALEILSTTCPTQYPQTNGDLTFDVTIRNNGNSASIPKPLSLHRKYSTNSLAQLLGWKYGEAIIPSIPAGEIRPFTLTYPVLLEQILIPNTFISAVDGDRIIGDALTFENDPISAEGSYDIDLYCQKEQVDLALELSSDDFTYDENGIISYTMRVSNNSNIAAHNLSIIYAYAHHELEFAVSLDIPDDTSIFGGLDPHFWGVPQYWIIPELGPHENREIHVTYKMNNYPTAPVEFQFATAVVSPHLEDTNYANNSVNALFTHVDNITDGIDLELSLRTDTPDIQQWKSGTFTYTLENKGNIAATGINVRLRLTGDEAVLVGGSTAVTSNGSFSNNLWRAIDLPAGSSATLEVQLFSRVPNLTFYTEVIYANENDIDSTPNNQNETEDDFVRFSATTPLADLALQISNLQFPLQFPTNEVSRFDLDIVNMGSASASGEFLLAFLLSSDEIRSEDDLQVGEILTGYLSPGTYPSTAAVRIPATVAAGNYTLFAIADASNVITEMSEDNNVLQIPVSIVSGGNSPNLGLTQRPLQLAPNPATEVLHVQGIYETDTAYQLFDTYGSLLKSGSLADGAIAIQELANGTYYLKVANPENTLLRFVKLH